MHLPLERGLHLGFALFQLAQPAVERLKPRVRLGLRRDGTLVITPTGGPLEARIATVRWLSPIPKGGPGVPRHAVRTVRSGLIRVRRTCSSGCPGQAALRLRCVHVQHAEGWYASMDVRVSTGEG